jgi:excisionase family DNA binding protein
MKICLTVAEAAEYANVSRDTIYTACERCELRHARLHRRRAIRIKAVWIDEWLERYAQPVRETGSAASARVGDANGTASVPHISSSRRIS